MASGAAGEPSPLAAASPLQAEIQRELGGEIAVRGEIGRGALTVVFAGTETRPGREVVIHVVPPEIADREPERGQRLLRAARATAKLRHPRVAPIYRVAAGDRLCWYITRPDEGESLATIVGRDGPLPLERTSHLVAQIAAAIACAHEHGIVHGDLTPESILVGAGDTVSVKEFGILRASDAASTGRPTASLYYRAPELDAPGPSAIAPASATAAANASLSAITGMSAAADQYALGIIAWELLAGSLPFVGTDPEMIRREHRATPLPPLHAARPDLPAGVATVIERALAKRPTDRFPAVTKFAQSFRGAVEGRPSTAAVRPVPRRQTESLLLAPTGDGDDDAPIIRKKPRRHVVLGALGGATAFTILGLLIWRSTAGAEMTGAERERLEAASRAFESASAGTVAQPEAAAAATRQLPPPEEPPVAAPAPCRGGPCGRPQPSARNPRRPAAAERSRPAAAPETAWITVGTYPHAAIFINETPIRGNPVRNWPVPAGAVFLRFEVLDTESGVWTRDTVVTLAAGDTLNLRRIRLARP